VSDPTPPLPIAGLTAEIAEIKRALAGAPAPAQREALKPKIVALLKRTESALAELNAARQEIRDLVERYKRLATETERPEPPMREAGVRADHLGASTYIEKGWSLIALGDAAGAIQALTRSLELAPGDPQAKSLLGWAQMLAERHDEALLTFSEVLAVEPANALARVNVGFICLKKRIFGEAIEHLSRVIRLDNDRKATLYAHYYLGLVYLERDMHLDAQAFLRKAIALGPNLVEAYYDLGRAQWFAGEPEAARETWRRGAAASRFAPWAKRCRDLLDAVERGEAVPRSSSAA
jgi:tetratricopeptide (TPR) repeat protein